MRAECDAVGIAAGLGFEVGCLVNARYPGCPSVKQALANIAAWVKNTPKEGLKNVKVLKTNVGGDVVYEDR